MDHIDSEPMGELSTDSRKADGKKGASTQLAAFLGHVTIIGAAAVALPQIFKIHRARSADGLSLSAFLTYLLKDGVSIAYCSSRGHPFSAYGERCVLFLNNSVIILQILRYQKRLGAAALTRACAAMFSLEFSLCSAKRLIGERCGDRFTEVLHAAMVLFGPIGMVLQIISNFRQRSTGQLDLTQPLVSVFAAAIRVYTALQQQRGSPLIVADKVLSFAFNGTLAAQIAYGGFKAAPIDH